MSAELKEPAARKAPDDAIERLERAITDEREHSAGLRATVDELRFKAEILERSYAKQLEDARRRADSAEQALTEQRARNAELDAAREDAVQLLTEAKAELDRLAHERDRFRRQLASRSGWGLDEAGGAIGAGGAGSGESGDDAETAEDGTINSLMDDASWLRKRRPIEEARAQAEAARRAADEPEGDMIAPEAVFVTAKNDD